MRLVVSREREALKTVLIPHREDAGGIYIEELARAYTQRGFRVETGAAKLYDPAIRPDIIHLQWPEEHYRWRAGASPERLSAAFLSSLDEHRKRGARVAWTVHNIAPHEHRSSAFDRTVYERVMSLASVIVHHCEASKSLLRETYDVPKEAAEVVSPMGGYFAYPGNVTKEHAREMLGLPKDAFVYLSFGLIRAYKGLDLLLRAFRRCRAPRKYLLIAGLHMHRPWRLRLQLWTAALLSRNVRVISTYIPHDKVQPMIASCDVLVLSHLHGLNSAVAVLGVSSGRPVVGPRMGCIASVLEQGCNMLYEPGNAEALTAAMQRASSLDLALVEQENVRVARSWKWEGMADSVLHALGVAHR